MRNLPRAIHGHFREARRSLGLTQSALARWVGCRQSAISMFESGRDDALSWETLEKLAAILELDILPAASAGSTTRIRKYCPAADCPSNIPYAVAGELCFQPTLVEFDRSDECDTTARDYCTACGELLESGCPHPDCGAPLGDGAFCPRCGERYVAVTVELTEAADVWADRRRTRIESIRALSRPVWRTTPPLSFSPAEPHRRESTESKKQHI